MREGKVTSDKLFQKRDVRCFPVLFEGFEGEARFARDKKKERIGHGAGRELIKTTADLETGI